MHSTAHYEICNTYCCFTAKMVSRTRLNVMLYVHCQFCWKKVWINFAKTHTQTRKSCKHYTQMRANAEITPRRDCWQCSRVCTNARANTIQNGAAILRNWHTQKYMWQGGLCMAHHQYQNPPLDTIFCEFYPRNEIHFTFPSSTDFYHKILRSFIFPLIQAQPIKIRSLLTILTLLDASCTHYSSSLCNCLFISRLWDTNTVQIPT
jgi:hypothetical protein